MLQKIKMVDLCEIAYKAGAEILKVYESDFTVETKEDNSPLTLADKMSHQVIVSALTKLYPEIPVLSEEGQHLSYDERKSWDYVWVVDPLDGTKEFVKRNDEFTVNIALIQNGRSVMGVIYAPVLDAMYVAKENVGSFKFDNYSEVGFTSDAQLEESGLKLTTTSKGDQVNVIASRSHLSKETEEYIAAVKEQYGEVNMLSAGSSLKLCLVAEGAADVYPRFAPTMEWDTAAGQAIVEQAGGTVEVVETGNRLTYNRENLLNPWFIVKRKGF